MVPDIPDAADVRAALAPLSLKQLDKLAALSGVPATTIYKIKLGLTKNPGVVTLRKFIPHIPAALADGVAPAAAAAAVVSTANAA